MRCSRAGFIGDRKLRAVNSRKIIYFSRIYDPAGNAIETQEHAGDFNRAAAQFLFAGLSGSLVYARQL
jgi:hypothetical protein